MTPELNWLTDPTVFAVNRLDAHSDHVCYKTEAETETGLTSPGSRCDLCLALRLEC